MRAELVFPKLRPCFFLASVGYGYSPIQVERPLSTMSGSLGVGLDFSLGNFFSIRPFAEGGAYNSFLNAPVEMQGGAYAYFGGGLGFAFEIGPSFSLGLVGKYQNYYDAYSGIAPESRSPSTPARASAAPTRASSNSASTMSSRSSTSTTTTTASARPRS
jgi:hypothetical protein